MSDVNGSYITTKSQQSSLATLIKYFITVFIYIYIYIYIDTDKSWLAGVCVGLYVGTDHVSIYGYMRLSQLRTLVHSITQQEVKIIKIVRIKTKDNTDNLGTH